MVQSLVLKESELSTVRLERDRQKSRTAAAKREIASFKAKLESELAAKDSQIENLKSEYKESALMKLGQELQQQKQMVRELKAENKKLITVKNEYQGILEILEREMKELKHEKQVWVGEGHKREMRAGLDQLKMKMIMLENREEGVQLQGLARDFGDLERKFQQKIGRPLHMEGERSGYLFTVYRNFKTFKLPIKYENSLTKQKNTTNP